MEEEPKPPAPIKLTSLMISNALDSPTAHTSFGTLPLAVERSAPQYSFGTGNRQQLNKVFQSEQLCITNTKISPGPKYDVHDNQNFKTSPNFSFTKDQRVTLGKPQYYDHFSIYDNFSDSIRAKGFTHTHYGTTKFGTQSRIPVPDIQGAPGPQYYPPIKPEVPIAPSFTLGARRTNPGGSVLEDMVSTTQIVGPGRYVPQQSSYTSRHRNVAFWSFGRGDKIGKPPKPITKHQTYETRSVSCGVQANSRKRTFPNAKIGSATREQVGKLGMFRDMMSTQQPSVRISMPKF